MKNNNILIFLFRGSAAFAADLDVFIVTLFEESEKWYADTEKGL